MRWGALGFAEGLGGGTGLGCIRDGRLACSLSGTVAGDRQIGDPRAGSFWIDTSASPGFSGIAGWQRKTGFDFSAARLTEGS